MGGCQASGGGSPPPSGTGLYGPQRPTCVAIASADLAVTSDDLWQVIIWNLNALPNTAGFCDAHMKKASYVTVRGSRIFSGSYDGFVHVSPLASPYKPAKKFNEHRAGSIKPEVWAVAVSTDGSRAVSSTNDGQILLWKPNSASFDVEKEFAPHGDEPVAALAFVGSSNSRVISGHAHGKVILWDTSSPSEVLYESKMQVNSVAVTSDGAKAAFGGFDKSIVLWDLNTKTRIVTATPLRHLNWVWRVAFSPKDNMLASAGEDGKVNIWDAQTGAFIKAFDAGVDGTMGVAWRNDDTVVYTGDGTTAQVQLGTIP
jgi:hypothetical protein